MVYESAWNGADSFFLFLFFLSRCCSLSLSGNSVSQSLYSLYCAASRDCCRVIEAEFRNEESESAATWTGFMLDSIPPR